ncbi:MAG: glutamine amidotransferase [Ruminococcaceae bacterium]|nr:glutamine amidotransferase [Oscillospiraceae bacterium]
MAYSIHILHMFPDLLNLYGDKGNIECLRKRLEWRGIEATVTGCTYDDRVMDFSKTDIVFLGGGSDREQKIVCSELLKYRDRLKDYVENGGVLVAVCGGYQLLGKYYALPDEKIEGLNILDIYTEHGSPRLIGNIVLKNDSISQNIVGFENHGGRTYIGDHTPLGKVVKGFGNTGESGAEGVLYKNVVATYLHGPLLPKNPQLCDLILEKALKQKYPDFTALEPLDDAMENRANTYMQDIILKN